MTQPTGDFNAQIQVEECEEYRIWQEEQALREAEELDELTLTEQVEWFDAWRKGELDD